ncbi:MAG: hypothetical protein CMK07_00640 [Ponticaulis sp.]|nr:hypothetical protein [Ponticaulis sp.]
MRYLGLCSSTAIVALCAVLPVSAQTVSEPTETPAETSADSVQMQDRVMVTAQRREEDLNDIPVAVTVLDDEQRDRMGIRTIEDFANFTPGMNFSTSLDRISLRGVGRLTNIIGSDPGVATYNDGFYTASSAEASKTPMFVERVEILRGPQGTLYGRNSVGGALNVVSKRPTQEFSGEVRGTYDQHGGYILEGFVSGGITDKLSARLSYQYGPRPIDYSFENVNPGMSDEGALDRNLLELQLQYDFTDTTELWFKYSHANWDDHFRSANLRGAYATGEVMPSGALVPNAAFGFTGTNPGVSDPRKINQNTRSSQTLDDNHNFVVNFKTQFGGVDVKYVGGHSTYYYAQEIDLDYTPVDLVATNAGTLGEFVPSVTAFDYTYNPTYIQEYIEDKTYYSNEVTFSNAEAGVFNWIVGLYQYHEEFYQPITQYQDSDGTDNMGAAMVAPLCLSAVGAPQASCEANPRRAFYAGTGDLEIDSYAIFGQADWEILPDVKLTAGLRYGIDEKTGVEGYRLVNWNPTNPDANCFNLGCGAFTPALDLSRLLTGEAGSGPLTRTLSEEFDGLTGRLAIDYKPNDDTLLFASYSRGLKSGGFNLGNWAESPMVDNEVVDAFEIGLKSRPVSQLQFNATGFFYDYKDAQIPISVLRTGSAFSTANFFNIPESQSLGLELESSWFPTNWLEFNATYSWLDTEITKTDRLFNDPATPALDLVDLKGNRLPRTSENQLALSTLFDIPIEKGDLFLAGSYIYRDSFYSSIFNTTVSESPSFDRVDLRATYVAPGGNITVIGFVRNVFDELGYDGVAAQTGSGSAGFGRIESYTTPRTYGAEIQFKF